MTAEQELFGEKIIQLHKKNDGVFEWDNLYNIEGVFPESWSTRKEAEQEMHMQKWLVELGLIVMIGSRVVKSSLTQNGYSFTTFKKFKKEQELYKSAKKNTAIKERYWWLWPILTAVAGYIAGLLLPIKLPQQIQESSPPVQVEKHISSDTLNKNVP